MKQLSRKRQAGFALFAVYLIFLVYVLFFWLRTGSGDASDASLADYARHSTNFVPFRTIEIYWYVLRRYGFVWRSWWVRNLLGNLVLFLPMGIFLPALFPSLRRWYRTILATALIVVCMEVLQLITRTGSCDVDDLILNVLGCAIGYLIWFLFYRLIMRTETSPLRKHSSDPSS